VLANASFGVLHATGSGDTTWCGFAREVFAAAGLDPERVRPTTTDRFPRPAPRPSYSVLADDGVTRPLPPWRSALAEAMPSLLGR
jgi:dTDP-4-dehydrorhamnose reductase